MRLIASSGSGSSTRMIDHVVCVDVGAHVVWDPAERYAIRLTPGSLDACVGNGFTLDRVKELRQLVLQVRRPEGKKKRRNNPEKRKRKRREAREHERASRYATSA